MADIGQPVRIVRVAPPPTRRREDPQERPARKEEKPDRKVKVPA